MSVNNPAFIPTWTNIKHVDGTSGNDTTGNGSIANPYKTIQKALDAIGSAANSTEYTASTTSRYLIEVGPGVYTESLTTPTRQVIHLKLNDAYISGNVTWTTNASLLPASSTLESKLVIEGTDLRSTYTGVGIPLVGIDGNLTVTTSGSISTTWKAQVHLLNCGVSGNITFDTASLPYQGFVFARNAFILTDTIITAGKGLAGSMYAWDCDSSTSKCLGGASGALNLSVLDNVIFNRAVVINNSAGGRWSNVNFQSASHDFTGMSGTIRADANSYESYRANVPTKGSETFTLVDNATGMAYTPTTSGDWISSPTTVLGALDNLADYVSGGLAPQVKTANYTAVKTDSHLYGATAGGAFAFTIPAASSVGAGKTYTIKKTDTHTNILTISRSSTDTFDYEGTTTTSLTCNTVNELWEITSDGSSKWYVNRHHTFTKPVSVTPTMTWTDNMTTNTLLWWREGNHLCGRGYILCSGTPSTGGNLIHTIPNSSVWAIDTTLLNTTSGDFEHVGTNKLLDAGVGWYMPGWLGYKTTTTLIFYNANTGVIGRALAVQNSVPFAFASGDAVMYEYKVPISGWYA